MTLQSAPAAVVTTLARWFYTAKAFLVAAYAEIKTIRWLKAGSVVFNAPKPEAQALLFRWRGLSMGGHFFGLVISNNVTITITPPVQKPAPKIQLLP